jgi:hypothetical protein
MNKPMSNKLFGNEIRGKFNMDRFIDWKASFQDERKMLNDFKKGKDIRNSRYYKYLIYLESAEWKAKRLLVLERDSYQCQFCKVAAAIDVHHITYNNLFNEPLEDLVSLCKPCHIQEHKRLKVVVI